MTSVTFSVPWVFGKQRPRFQRAGAGVRTYTPDGTRERESEASAEYRRQSMLLHGRVLRAERGVPVSVLVTTSRPLPKNRPKRVLREPDTVRFDADNVGKLVMDALNGVAYEDDSQVTALTVIKTDRERGAEERTYVSVVFPD